MEKEISIQLRRVGVHQRGEDGIVGYWPWLVRGRFLGSFLSTEKRT